MTKLSRIFAIAIIATFLAAIPLTVSGKEPDIVKVVNVLRVDDNYAKPPGSPGGGKGKTEGYAFILNGGYTWESAVNLVIDPTCTQFDGDFNYAIGLATAEWDSHTGASLFGTVSVSTLTLFAETDRPDGENELLFADLGDSGIIAQTTTWFSRIGKRIVDFDIVFNIRFSWGNCGETSETALGSTTLMDTRNIATHEIGHGLNLADLYATQWSEQTMYGYANYGETKKRTLDSGDIAGIQALYGA